jgi:homoserine kinase
MSATGGPPRAAVAFAPASVGNVAVGFDVLGHSFPALRDRVSVERVRGRGVHIAGITGVVPDLPRDPERNTAAVAVAALVDALDREYAFELTIDKGIPLRSGLGGSAASAVAAVVATNALLPTPFSKLQLLKFAIKGEAAASGTAHVDNIAPSLYGGLVLTVGIDDPIVKQIPVPPGVRCVVVHPHIELSTRSAREILKPTVSLSDVIWQQANLAGLVAGCFTADLRLIRASLLDVVIEPQRKGLIPGFEAVKEAALGADALGCSISGAGPSLFAWCEQPRADAVSTAMVDAFRSAGLACDAWTLPIGPAGAEVVEQS